MSNPNEGGALPNGWVWASPGSFFSWSSGKFLPKKQQRLGNVPVLGGNGVNGYHDEALVLNPTLVIGRVGAHCGNVHLTDGPTWITDNAIYAAQGADSAFLPYWVLAMSLQNLNANAGGTGQPYVNQRHLDELRIPLAPKAEQQRIVEVTESYVTRLDDAVATLARVGRNLKRYRASVLKSAVEGRLVPTEAALAKQESRDYEPASVLLERILAERRRSWLESGKKGKYQEPAPPDTTNVPDLPQGWCWATVDQLTTGERASGYGVLVPGPDVPDGVVLVRVGDIRDGRVHLEEIKRISKDIADQFQRTYLKGGELLISLVGSIGRTAVVPSTLAGANVARAVGVIPIAAAVDCRWAEHWFRSPLNQARIEGLAHEVARKTLNLEDVRSAVVAVPPRLEQTRIVDAVSDLESLAEASGALVDLSYQRTARLRQSILKWAFEGKLADQDPNDEPASMLLERIRAEREAAKPTKPTRTPRDATKKKLRA